MVGYLRLPDMERTGYSEFWRHFPHEVRKGALVVVEREPRRSHLGAAARKLAQRPLAWDVPRRGRPPCTPATRRRGCGARGREHRQRRGAGGGGVPSPGPRARGGREDVGRSVDHVGFLQARGRVGGVHAPAGGGHAPAGGVDSGRHPEIANGIENRGVVPDVEVANAPHDYATDADPQLDAAVREALALLAAIPRIRQHVEDDG